MKNTTLLLVFFAFTASLFLSSCAFLQKGEFAQRKYYDFPRSKHANSYTATKKTTPETNFEYSNKIELEKNTVASSNIQENIITPNLPANDILAAKEKTTLASPSKNTDAESIEIVKIKKSEIKTQALENKPYFPYLQDAGLMLLLAVIAAIFFPPIGIFIKENWRTTNWFWITLIMCLVAIGFLGVGNAGFGAIFGGLWLVAIIIALLVIFDAL